jgi:hypothetical protein
MAGEVLFKRKVRLLIAAPLTEDFASISSQVIEVTDLRVQFKATKTLSKEPNTAEITVTNLSATTRAALPTKGARLILQAGYGENLEQICLGDARFTESRREGPDWLTKFQIGDGERGFLHGRVSESFAAGVPVGEVIKTVGKTLKLDTGNLESIAAGLPGQYVSGYVASGPASKELDRALKAHGYEWSIQDGQIQVLKPGEATTEEVIELSPDSGLIGSPEMGSPDKKSGKSVLKAKSLLQGGIRPGRRVKIVSAQYNGFFKPVKVEHSGDTAGGDWYTTIEAEAL